MPPNHGKGGTRRVRGARVEPRYRRTKRRTRGVGERGGRDRADRKREKIGERGGDTVFFSRVNRGGLLGVHHTRGIYARIKEATLAPA